MSDGLTNDFWGLQRRLPRFAALPPVSIWEGLGIGALLGTLLVALAYAAQLVWFEQLQQWRPFTRNDYFIYCGWLFGVPLVLGLALFVLLRSTHPDPNLTDEIRFRSLRSMVVLLREKQRLGVIDWVFILLLPALAIFEVQFFGVSLDAHWREWPVGIAPILTGLLLRAFRRNPFVPVTHPIEIPAWIDELLPNDIDDPASSEEKKVRRAFCRRHGVVDRDDCSNEQKYFRYVFSEDLPPEIREIGVQCSSDVVHQMALFLSENGAAYYQNSNYQGAVRMIDLVNGSLTGAGLVEMKRLVAQILTRARHAGWSRYGLAEAILHFVQRVIAYAEDTDSTGHSEYGRFPLQTLLDGKGDCECTSILCCALLSYLGYETALVFGESASGTGHAIAALRPPADLPAFVLPTGRTAGTLGDWLYGETTLDSHTVSWQTFPSGSLAKIGRVVSLPIMALG